MEPGTYQTGTTVHVMIEPDDVIVQLYMSNWTLGDALESVEVINQHLQEVEGNSRLIADFSQAGAVMPAAVLPRVRDTLNTSMYRLLKTGRLKKPIYISGAAYFVRVMADIAEKMFGMPLRYFDTLDQALAAAREELGT